MNSNGPVVIKLGGLALEDPIAAVPLLAAIVSLHCADAAGVVLVHGGGKAIARQLEALDLESQVIDGIRVTPQSHIEQVVGVLAGQVNKALVAQLQELGQPALGLSIGDGLTARAQRLQHEEVDFGFVGEVTGGDSRLVDTLLAERYLPVLCPIAYGDEGELLNVNADSAAGAVASIVGARLLILLTDVPGIVGEDSKPLKIVDEPGINALIDQGVISGGMIPKARAALGAAQAAGTRTVIASWRESEAIAQIADGAPLGTQIEIPTPVGDQL